ncbi:MAG: hypothetical protein Q9M91_02720 [Candidatus Dojkabacteria bacterium]|nr:hypothetical protein [Candidatus Dojkabacteria bacterium]MDQ7020738.1 hypothetical protein [Candidatus Dojkabacteria bacterium]
MNSKKAKFIAFIFFVAISIGGSRFYGSKTPNTFTLLNHQGEISYEIKGESTFNTLEDTYINLSSGATVKTSEDSFAHLYIDSKTIITLDENTEVQVIVEDRWIELKIEEGKIWNRILEGDNGKEYIVSYQDFRFNTNEAIFSVDTTSASNNIIIKDNQIEISQFDKDKIVFKSILKDNRALTLEKDLKEPIIIPKEIEKSLWYRRNNYIDGSILNSIDRINSKNFTEEFSIIFENVDTYLGI